MPKTLSPEQELLKLKLRKAEALERELELKEGLPFLYGYKLYQWQQDYMDNRYPDVNSLRKRFMTAANQIGKMTPCDTDIPTPSGFRKCSEIAVGDSLYDQYGKETKVTHIPYEGVRPSYKITFDDGASIVAGQEHLWTVQTERNRFRPEYTCNRGRNKGQKIPNPSYGKWEVMETQEIIAKCGYEDGKTPRNGKKAVIPVCEPVQYPEKDLPVDAYFLGAMIGDGDCKNGVFGCGDPSLTKRLAGNRNIYIDARKKDYTLFNLSKEQKDKLALVGMLGKVSSNKFIPRQYLLGSVERRLDLLRGLMDTDGSIYGKNQLEYATISKELKDDFIELINSLGGIVNKVSLKDAFYYNDNRERVYCNKAWAIRFRIQVNPFWIERKADKWRKDIRYKHQRIIEKIEYVGEQEGRCFTVDNEDHTFLAGKEYIVTHNSHIQIADDLVIATHPEMWSKIWPEMFSLKPNAIPFCWYLYPNQDTVMSEFEEKWVKDLLPKGTYKDHPQFGWKHKILNKVLKYVEFNTGYRIYFKTYNQNVHDLQAGTVWKISFDEEPPFDIMPELEARIFATDGHMSAVFTATKGQEDWRRVMEEVGTDSEIFPGAWKRQVSMYDCMSYADGTETLWTKPRIQRKIDSCKSTAEVQRRIHGRFVKDSGLKYPTFNRARNFKKRKPRADGTVYTGVPNGWSVYSGVDWGSGGKSGHPSSIVFIAANPSLTKLRLFRCRRYDKIETTAGDLFQHYKKLKGNLVCAGQVFDWAAKDFGTIASRAGEPFEKANKDHAEGEQALNTALKTGMLVIYNDEEGEAEKLAREFESLGENEKKQKAKDDLIDATRYALMSIPIDWDLVLNGSPAAVAKKTAVPGSKEDMRPNDYWSTDEDKQRNESHYQDEFDFWNETLLDY